ncbi:hypothetical protein MKW92_005869 [Papaver armeniacum]|nr:hypothetical protein MKW92_005869 [Papaver armeniacum]
MFTAGSMSQIYWSMVRHQCKLSLFNNFFSMADRLYFIGSMFHQVRSINFKQKVNKSIAYAGFIKEGTPLSLYVSIEANDGKPLPLYQKALCGLTAGAIGASVGSPADLALIRMQADYTLPQAQRRNYKNAALTHIVTDEGVLALWKGAGSTVVRAMALNMHACFIDHPYCFFLSISIVTATGKFLFQRRTFNIRNPFSPAGASAVSGFFAAACSLPFDYVKTQIQKMQPDAHGNYPYSGSLDCVVKTLKAGGPFKLYTGFPVYCIRIAPHVMMTWIFLNQIQKVQENIGL